MAKPKCKECGKKDRAPGRTRCYSCYGKARRNGTPKPIFVNAEEGPRILFIDIETRPNLGYFWGLFNQNIGVNQIEQAVEMMCFVAKWYGSDETMFYHGRTEEDKIAMIAAAWKLLDEADIVVHFYGSRFDIPHLNREFLQNGFLPPSPFKQVDLKAVCSKKFMFTSNKLQFVSTQLGLEGKESTDFDLWKDCMYGNDEAWAKMESYNRQDVILLEEVYELLLPWIPSHPHRHLYGGQGCPKCGNTDPFEDAGFAYTALSVFKQYRCTNCGDHFRDGKRLGGVGIRESVR